MGKHIIPYNRLMDPNSLILDALNNNLSADARHLIPYISRTINQHIWLGIKALHDHEPTISQFPDSFGCYYFTDDDKNIEQSIHSLPNHSFAIILGYHSSMRQARKKKSIFYLLTDRSIHTLFFEPLGKLSLLHNYPSIVNVLLQKVGVHIPNTSYSPFYILIIQKNANKESVPYISKTNFKSRLSRVYERIGYKLLKRPGERIALLVRSVLPVSPKACQSRVNYHSIDVANTDKIRIAFVTGQLAPGGVEAVLLNIISSLPRSKYHITLYTTTWNANLWEPRFREICDDIIAIPQLFGHSFPYKYTVQLFIDYISNLKPHILFITNSTAAYTSLPHIHNIDMKVVDLLHTYGTPQEKDAFLRVSAPYNSYLTKRIVISHFLKEYLIQNYAVSEESVAVIYNGISPKKMETTSDTLAKLGIAPYTRVISFIGRLQPDKSPERLVEIASRCKDTLIKESAVLLVVGTGEMQDLLTRKVEELNLSKVIKFIGYHPNPLSILEQSSFSILTSNLEGIPMSIIESLMVGTPPISTSVGGIPEMYDSSCGYLIANDEYVISNFCTAIESGLTLQKETYERMRIKCTDRYNQQFSHMGQDYIHLFESIRK